MESWGGRGAIRKEWHANLACFSSVNVRPWLAGSSFGLYWPMNASVLVLQRYRDLKPAGASLILTCLLCRRNTESVVPVCIVYRWALMYSLHEKEFTNRRMMWRTRIAAAALRVCSTLQRWIVVRNTAQSARSAAGGGGDVMRNSVVRFHFCDECWIRASVVPFGNEVPPT